MIGSRLMRLSAVATSLLCCGVALALSGTLLDPEGKPVTGGRACYLVAGVEQLCVEADDKGFFDLPDSRVDTIRVHADGYLPQTLLAVSPDKPIVLRRAAIIRVVVKDASSGEAIDSGHVELLYPDGRKRRFIFNRAGVRVRSLHPGNVRVLGVVEGYEQASPVPVTLVAGKESTVELSLTPVPAEAGSSGSS